MSHYHPHTQADTAAMLATLGLATPDDLFADIPQSVRLRAPLSLPQGLSQMDTLAAMEALAEQNTRYRLTLRGAGCYDHFIPPLVSQLAGKEEFVTAYTPYQAELSQGILQAIFEYQSLICALTGMDASNAGVYDGASAAAEAAVMCRERGRTVTLVSACAHPDTLAVVRTYAYGTGHEVRVVPAADGHTDLAALQAMLTPDIASLYIQQPNYFGQLEDVPALFAAAKAAGVKCILGANPMTLAMLPSGAEVGADIVCGDVQPFGIPMAFGGPSAGFMAATAAMQRKLPGRIAGQTTDAQGRRAFVLTLQAREQHIRREKATSNICTNQAHCALTAGIYLTYLGTRGLTAVAERCLAHAHAFAELLTAIPGVRLRHRGVFFHEFVTELPVPAQAVEAALEAQGVLSGLPLDGGMLWCVTEKASLAQLTRVAEIVREVCAQ
ncbi:MAG: aminomethyl-transferring glycine dehydrogenase subunit GcvPA [Candidatus Limiplasma sp.]|nr:aminomethyl-transferring glycine dehydrogenase subunit GcvPA [Candidatus Limiplasma sp.]MEA5145704.1 aminomethyl-transferring glycine dehydrogenase subunit GcvPA [Candidatus Limiplasma sp.]